MTYLSKHGLPGTRWSVHEDIAIDSAVTLCVDGCLGEASQPCLKLRLRTKAVSDTISQSLTSKTILSRGSLGLV